jgi:hypothetical protein
VFRRHSAYSLTMLDSLPFTTQQLARLGAYHGWDPDELAGFLASRLDDLSLQDATRIAREACAERQAIVDGESERLDAEARAAEHDLRRRRRKEAPLARTPANERAVQDALEAATVFHAATGISFDRLTGLVQGAFVLPPHAARLVAEEAIEQAERMEERSR